VPDAGFGVLELGLEGVVVGEAGAELGELGLEGVVVGEAGAELGELGLEGVAIGGEGGQGVGGGGGMVGSGFQLGELGAQVLGKADVGFQGAAEDVVEVVGGRRGGEGFLMQEIQGEEGVAFGFAGQAGVGGGGRGVQRTPHQGGQVRGVDGAQANREGAKSGHFHDGGDFGVVAEGDTGDASGDGEDEGVEAHAEDEVHFGQAGGSLERGEGFLDHGTAVAMAELSVETPGDREVVLMRIGGGLKGDEDGLTAGLVEEEVEGARDFLLPKGLIDAEGPVAEGDGDARGSVGRRGRQGQGQGESGVGGDGDAVFGDAEGLEEAARVGVAHRDEGRQLGNDAGEAAAVFGEQGAHADGVQDERLTMEGGEDGRGGE
jgi:hypothetical protein